VNPADEPKSMARRLLVSLGEDIGWGLRELLVNCVAGFVLTPRAVRYLLYRLAGLDIRTPGVYPGCKFMGFARIHIGANSFVNRDCCFEANSDITLGNDVMVAMQVLFVTSGHAIDAEGRAETASTSQPIRVGDRCWLGARVTVLPGVTIGDDVVIAAGSVVTKECAPGGLYAGVPARRIRELPRGSRTNAAAVLDPI
jgi:maltose O-acetyltransferase